MQAWLAAQQGSISGGVMGPNYQLGYQQTPQGAQGSISWQQYLSNYGSNAQLNIGGLYGNGPQGQTVGGSIGVSGIPSNWPINGSIWSAAANVTITPGPNSSQTIGGNIGVTW